jgi:tRNA(Leu) C34 or U34 (ribose-2'-O)-methylase TrmL
MNVTGIHHCSGAELIAGASNHDPLRDSFLRWFFRLFLFVKPLFLDDTADGGYLTFHSLLTPFFRSEGDMAIDAVDLTLGCPPSRTVLTVTDCLALDTVQNPDNLGAISRTAEAFGIDGMVICGGCDIYNPKALRASMGALFRLPVKVCKSLEDEINLCKNIGIQSFATVPDRDAYDITKTDFSKGALCIIGNEGNGVSKEIIDVCDKKITIKMQGRAESLNAAAAASILIWEMMR